MKIHRAHRKRMKLGGARAGAGRPPRWLEPAKARTVRLPAAVWAVVDDQGGEAATDRLLAALANPRALRAILAACKRLRK